MEQNVKEEIEELRVLATTLHAILRDTQHTLTTNRQDFENVSREINGIIEVSAAGGEGEASGLLRTVAELARRIEEKTAHLSAELASLQQRVAEVETHAERWRERALTDALTRLPNRRAGEAALTRAISAASNNCSKHCCVAMVDIDHFKQINDTYGHAVGDAVLRFVAYTIRKNLRAEDFVARWGGEEFLVIFSQTDLLVAQEYCERLRKEIQGRRFTLRDSGKPIGQITVSIGLTGVTSPDSPANVLERADRALYAAKASGRNTIRLERGL